MNGSKQRQMPKSLKQKVVSEPHFRMEGRGKEKAKSGGPVRRGDKKKRRKRCGEKPNRRQRNEKVSRLEGRDHQEGGTEETEDGGHHLVDSVWDKGGEPAWGTGMGIKYRH